MNCRHAPLHHPIQYRVIFQALQVHLLKKPVNVSLGDIRPSWVCETRDDECHLLTGIIDLLTSSTPYHRHKVSLKLHQLQYKLDVEEKMLAGYTRMADAIPLTKNIIRRPSSSEVHTQMHCSSEKVRLLKRALAKYEDLYIDDEDGDETSSNDSIAGMYYIRVSCLFYLKASL